MYWKQKRLITPNTGSFPLYKRLVIVYNYHEVIVVAKSNIVYLKNNKSGTVYAYEDHPYWDSEKKQSRSKRKILGKVDPLSGTIVPTRGRKAKVQPEKVEEKTTYSIDAIPIISKVLVFLRLFICETLAKRIVCMVLIAVGVPDNQIAELIGLCDKSVQAIKRGCETGELDSMFSVAGGGRKGKLADVEDSIVDEIVKNEYYSHQEIADMILERYGIKVSLPAISRLLKKKGIRRLKCGSLPAKADPAKQRSFYNTVLKPLMDQAKLGKATLLFMDASHFVMGCDFLGCIYGLVRKFIRTYSGRRRYNVLGALNFVTKKVSIVSNDTYITATEICTLLRKVFIEYRTMQTSIFIILDNARYQKCKIVAELASQLGIHLVYIPPYSPNLNLIERLWKHVKNRLRTKHYDDFDVFQETIDSIVADTDKCDKAIIDRLIGDKVQLFDDLSVDMNSTNYGLADAKKAA